MLSCSFARLTAYSLARLLAWLADMSMFFTATAASSIVSSFFRRRHRGLTPKPHHSCHRGCPRHAAPGVSGTSQLPLLHVCLCLFRFHIQLICLLSPSLYSQFVCLSPDKHPVCMPACLSDFRVYMPPCLSSCLYVSMPV